MGNVRDSIEVVARLVSELCLTMTPVVAIDVATLVAGHFQQPVFKMRLTRKCLIGSAQLEEGFLSDIFGEARFVKDAGCKASNCVSVMRERPLYFVDIADDSPPCCPCGRYVPVAPL